MTVPPGGPALPPDPWYRRYWVYPYPGCGCLWTILIFLLLWWLLALLFPPVAIWRRPVPVEPRPEAVPESRITRPMMVARAEPDARWRLDL